MLFSQFQRTDGSTKRYRETEFEFIDRSADPDVAAVRALLEVEFDRYIEADKPEIQARLQSRRDREFKSACFELLLYGMLSRLGFHLETHPDPGTGKGSRPDFLVTTPKGESFFLEAVLAADVRDSATGTRAMKDELIDAIDRDPHPNFYLSIVESGVPASQPSAKRLRKHLHHWLNGLDVDAVAEDLAKNGHEHLPSEHWEHDGWELRFRVIPKQKSRGKLDRLIGTLSGDAGWVDLKTPIREAIRFKGQRYGSLALPLVVAVNVDAFHLNQGDEVDALFGSEALAISQDNVRRIRRTDGAWHDGREPRSSRVSAAWLFNDLSFWSIAGRRQTLYVNPWALTPLGNALDCLPVAKIVDGEISRTEGPSPGEIFSSH
ncbi:hypothetical protein [Dyella sp. C9]|uniref:hypothetical protein n=1 Tax=Dyella sp. C9 TaxID=2202154 RepID=UPI00130052AE|nr:hypothetical protein [Dyella sp. C9]